MSTAKLVAEAKLGGKVVIVAQWDDQALYVDGRKIVSGSHEVNGAHSVLRALKIPVIHKSIAYDIWQTEFEGWPDALTDIPRLEASR